MKYLLKNRGGKQIDWRHESHRTTIFDDHRHHRDFSGRFANLVGQFERDDLKKWLTPSLATRESHGYGERLPR